MPVKTTPRRSPQAKLASTLINARTSCACTAASASTSGFKRSSSSARVAGVRLSVSSFAASRRRAGSAEDTSTAARSSPRSAFNAASVSVFNAFSISGSFDSSAPSRNSRTA
jgi:hypothetical protein